MVHKKEVIVKDLRDYVIEVTFSNDPTKRLTLKPDLLPPSYEQDIKKDETSFNSELNEYVIAWDVRLNQWKKFDLNTVKYLQIIDSY